MYQNCCKKCGSIYLHTETKGSATGLYCDDCGAWVKWLGKDEKRAFEYAMRNATKQESEVTNNYIESISKPTGVKFNDIDINGNLNMYGYDDDKPDIEIGKLCCFKPIGKDDIYFGHMAGKVVDNFENMSFLYVLLSDGKYYFSRDVIIHPNDVLNANDARKYFKK